MDLVTYLLPQADKILSKREFPTEFPQGTYDEDNGPYFTVESPDDILGSTRTQYARLGTIEDVCIKTDEFSQIKTVRFVVSGSAIDVSRHVADYETLDSLKDQYALIMSDSDFATQGSLGYFFSGIFLENGVQYIFSSDNHKKEFMLQSPYTPAGDPTLELISWPKGLHGQN